LAGIDGRDRIAALCQLERVHADARPQVNGGAANPLCQAQGVKFRGAACQRVLEASHHPKVDRAQVFLVVIEYCRHPALGYAMKERRRD